MTLTTGGYLGPLAGMPGKSEIAAPARRFDYLATSGDGAPGGQKRVAAHSAKGKGATSVESGA